MNPKQALAWVKKSGIAVESARARVPSLAQFDRRRTAAGQLVGTSEGRRDIHALASDSLLAQRFGVPPGGWENYLRPSADVARARFAGRTITESDDPGLPSIARTTYLQALNKPEPSQRSRLLLARRATEFSDGVVTINGSNCGQISVSTLPVLERDGSSHS